MFSPLWPSVSFVPLWLTLLRTTRFRELPLHGRVELADRHRDAPQHLLQVLERRAAAGRPLRQVLGQRPRDVLADELLLLLPGQLPLLIDVGLAQPLNQPLRHR